MAQRSDGKGKGASVALVVRSALDVDKKAASIEADCRMKERIILPYKIKISTPRTILQYLAAICIQRPCRTENLRTPHR
jgi:hypothetical protein